MAQKQVDFCHLTQAGQVDSFLCRSALRLIDTGMQVLVRAENDNRVREISRQLWVFPLAFISHEIIETDTAADSFDHQIAQLLLGSAQARWPCPALINLGAVYPPDHQNFDRIVEIVAPESDLVGAGRQRWRLYQEHGYDLRYHKIEKRS